MKLNDDELQKKGQWEARGYRLPLFDRKKVQKATREEPLWIHFGGGNLFRAFPANLAQKLLDAGVLDRGVIVTEGSHHEVTEKIYRSHDNLCILATLKSDGSVEKTVVGSIMESCVLDRENRAEFQRLEEIFQTDSLQMASFTITEKGYRLTDGKGMLLSSVQGDFAAGPEKSVSYMGKIAALLYTRFRAGEKPIALVSMDNCSHNGDRLYEAVRAFAAAWQESGQIEGDFLGYITDREKVSFPWSMIDKITPRLDDEVKRLLEGDGVEELEPVVTPRGAYIAPFVNAEECEYLVIEDWFPAGRPKLEQAGVFFTDRETVDKVEKMKVCTCLNPLHTALAVFGCLLGYERISQEMQDTDLKRLVEHIGYEEGLPVVTDPLILNPKAFLDTVLHVRLPNPFMPDTPQRIATDTSQKLAVRFGETIRAYADSEDRDVEELVFIPLVLAGWLRYRMGIDDKGNPFPLSPDPLMDEIHSYIAGFRLGEDADVDALRPLLENEAVFGVNLYEVGIADRVCGYLQEMLAGPGAVRAVLRKYV